MTPIPCTVRRFVVDSEGETELIEHTFYLVALIPLPV